MKTGRIIRSLSGYYDVQLADGTVERTRARGQFRKSKQKPVVGDFVDFESENDEGFIWQIKVRENELIRPLIANVDLAVIVTAVRQPDFTNNLLDRQLVALAAADVQPVIYFSKLDLLEANQRADFEQVVQLYRHIGYSVVCSDQEPLSQLKQLFKDKVVVFMGQTGAGKSTLLNQIAPELNLTTGEVSKALSRGKHTTRQVSLITISSYEAMIADTPGFSSYEVFDFPVEDLADYFPEMAAISGQCRFRGCLHLNEPGCAVKAAVELGTIAPSRYNDYKLFYNLIKQQKPRYSRE